MHFSRMIQAGAFIATLACCAAALPVQAQDALRVVDARGHQVGILVPVQGFATTAAMPDIDMFEAVDRMMARNMALMEAVDRTLASRLDGVLRAVPAVGHDLSKQSMSWQRFEAVSTGGPTACTQTITITSNGRGAPIVHVSRTGSKACPTLAAPMAVDNPGDQKTGSMALTPAVETRTEVPTNGRAGSAL
ncbi:hypothetical protein HLH26_13645 [Gluconacetobacter sp. 1b LMG 1731]|uniref:Uncharacterized protein n=2 Tax=Gluconacetobacter TaxID=89583 RepID=A0A7W4IMG2_9PROT|nr:hypothetical protein [Gluconacetobacter dulcium]MBB2165558.1 hypothetical protein [Gluconacetobacter dulcium]MBB2194694.1 hypothetical protein [Gluconacetobacter dulcium]